MFVAIEKLYVLIIFLKYGNGYNRYEIVRNKKKNV